jgi:hypothetical protein
MPVGWLDSDKMRGDTSPATGAAAELHEGLATALEAANGSSWYEEGNTIDQAVASLCRLRRAASGDRARAEGGDDAVREALAQASPDALVWAASRMISYLDENGFVEALGWVEREPPG